MKTSTKRLIHGNKSFNSQRKNFSRAQIARNKKSLRRMHGASWLRESMKSHGG